MNTNTPSQPTSQVDSQAASIAGAATDGSSTPVNQPPREDSSSGVSLNGNLPESVLRIPVSVQVIIGSVQLPLSRVAQLGPGATIALDQKLGALATILVNGKEVARGELFVLDEEGNKEQLGITIVEVGSSGRLHGR